MTPYQDLLEYFVGDKRRAFGEMNLFEAGFGDFGNVLDLYYQLPFQKYYGMEIYKEQEMSVTYTAEPGIRASRRSTAHSTYQRYLIYCDNCKINNRLHEAQFNDLFSLKFEQKIENHITSSHDANKFNLGIFSNLFHKFSDKETPKKILRWFYKSSSPNAYLLVKVRLTSYTYQTPKTDFTYKDSEISELLNSFPGTIIKQRCDDGFKTYLMQKTAHNSSVSASATEQATF